MLQFPKQIVARGNHAHRRADQTDQLVYSPSADFEQYQTARDDLVGYANIGALDIRNWVKYIARHGQPGVDWMPNNDTTRAAMMVHGVNEGEDARIVTAWLGLGNPDYTIFVPAWAAQKSDLSARVTSASSATIGYVSDRLLSKNDRNNYDQYINGLLGPVEDNIFEAVSAARSHWFGKGFDLNEATRIHKEAAETAWQTMNSMSAGSGRALNTPPNLTAINSSINGLQVTFSLVASDSNGTITAYDWDFGDGTSSTASSPTHSYTSASIFLVRARVVDNGGARNSKWLYITVSASGATPTSTPTPTKTPTHTSTPSNTPTSMPTPAATNSPTATPTPSNSQTFADVPLDHPYHDEIEALHEAGYTAGCATDPLRYCPDATMNRGESAVFVERGIHSASYVPPSPSSQVFADLPLDSWAAGWVNGLWADHYTAGCGTNPLMYCPWQGHTRAEGSVFYLRMLHGADFVPTVPTTQVFTDVPLDAWYAGWVHAAYSAGLIPPCQNSPELRFCPNDPLSRGLAAYMMVQAKGLAPLPSDGTALFVAPWGDDSNPGTSAAPYGSFAKATSALGPGNTLFIHAGVYNERLSVSSSGTDAEEISVRPYGGTVTIDLKSGAGPVVDLQGSHITVQDLEVMGSNGVCVNLAGDYTTADHLIVHECQDHGIYVNSASHVRIQNSTVYRTVLSNADRSASSGWGSAIKVRLSEDVLVQGNTVYNNYGEGMGLRGSYISVRGNTVYDNFSVGIYSNSDHLLVERNFVYCTPDSGFERDGAPMIGIGLAEEYFPDWGSHATDLTIINNIVYACKNGFRYGGAETGVTGAGLRNTVIAYNTYTDSTHSAIGIAYESAQADVRIANNIVTTGASLTSVDNPVGITFTHNLWKSSPPSYADGEGDRIGVAGFSPGYSSDSFRLPSSSMAIGGAIPLQDVSDDFTGAARGTNPDMGAFQHEG